MGSRRVADRGRSTAEETLIALGVKVEREIAEAHDIVETAVMMAPSQVGWEEFESIRLGLGKIEKEHSDYEEHAKALFALLNLGKDAEAELAAGAVEAEELQLVQELQEMLGHLALKQANLGCNSLRPRGCRGRPFKVTLIPFAPEAR